MPATIAVVQPKGLNAVNVKVDGGPRTVIQAKGAITDPTVDSGPEIIESSNEPSNPTIKDDLVMGSVIQRSIWHSHMIALLVIAMEVHLQTASAAPVSIYIGT